MVAASLLGPTLLSLSSMLLDIWETFFCSHTMLGLGILSEAPSFGAYLSHLFSGSCYCPNLNPRSSTNLLILQTYLGIPMSFLRGAWPGKGARHRALPWPMKIATNSLTFLPLKDKIYIPTSCMWAGFMTAFNNILQHKSHCDFLDRWARPTLSFVCMTKLVLSVKGIFKTGLHLFFILTGDSGCLGFSYGGPGSRFLTLETLFLKDLLGIHPILVSAFHGLCDSIFPTELRLFSPL